MSTFELSPEHEAFRRAVRDFAEKQIAPHVAEWDRKHHFPVDLVHEMLVDVTEHALQALQISAELRLIHVATPLVTRAP